MKYFISVLLSAVLAQSVYAHELTPTYFELKQSYMTGISKVDLVLFNRREDVRFYEITVHEEDWDPIEFATSYRIVEINYLERKNIEVFLKNGNKNPVYICTTSKLEKENTTATVISSRVCSKIK